MARLTYRDHMILHERIPAFYSHLDRSAFPTHVLSILQKVIPSEYVSYNEINLRPQSVRAVLVPSTRYYRPEAERIFTAYLHEHPLIDHHRRTGDGEACKISDFLTQREFKRLALYNEFYRPLGVTHQMAIALPLPFPSVVGIACNRHRKDFSERDRLCLNLIRPHLYQAYTIAQAFMQIKQALARGGQKPAGEQTEYPITSLQRLGLTPREAEVLFWVTRGCSNEEVADILTIRPRTVEKHLEHIYQKLGVDNRGTAAYRALKTLGIPST